MVYNCFLCGKEYILTKFDFCDECRKKDEYILEGKVIIDREEYDSTSYVGGKEITEFLDYFEDEDIILTIVRKKN